VVTALFMGRELVVSIYVTTAANDKDLVQALTSKGLAIPQSDLPADFAFKGQWDGGRDMWVCGDRKKVTDLLQCIRDGRHVRQIQRCSEAGYEIQYLIIEGQLLKNMHTGKVSKWVEKGLTSYHANMDYSEVQAYLEQLQIYGGIQVRYSKYLMDTVEHILQAWKTLTKPPDAHQVLHKVYSTPHTGAADMLRRRPSLLRRIAKELPGVGWELSQRVEDHYSSIAEMMEAPTIEWKKIDGIGLTKAQTIRQSIADTHFRSTARRE